jgi:hypothetical protein
VKIWDEILTIIVRRRLANDSTDQLRKGLLHAIGEQIARQAVEDKNVCEQAELANAQRQLKGIGEYYLLDEKSALHQ